MQLLGARKALESSTQMAAIADESGERAASDLDTRALEREAMPRRVSKYGVVAVTRPICCALEHTGTVELLWLHLWASTTASASEEVIVNWYWYKRENDETTGVMEVADSIPTFAVDAGGKSSRRSDAGLACGHEQLQRVESQSSTRKRVIEKSGRQVGWRVLSAQRWVRQRASHNRRTPQVTDHGLLSERK